MKKFIMSKKIAYFLGIILLLLIWSFISFLIDERTLIFPDPYTTIKETIILLGKNFTYKCIFSSLVRFFIGFFISLLLSIIFGVTPFIVSLKSIPTAALVFLFLVILGARNTPIAMVILVAFPILYEAISGGIENMDQDIIKSIKLENTSKFRNIFSIQLPLIMPYLLVGMASSFTLSFKIEIMSEILTGDTRMGLGAAILSFQKTDPINMIPIFSYSLIVIILSLIFTSVINIFKKKFRI